ncbi:MAG: CpaF family protein [Micrococcales bacterium]
MSIAEISRAAHALTATGFSAELALDSAVDRFALEGALPLSDERELRRQARMVALGFGPLQSFIDDPEIEEIWINRPSEVYLARRGVVERHFLALTASDIATLTERMLRVSGRRLDRSTPFVDAALPDGSRLHVVIPDIAREHWSLNIRKFPNQIWNLAELAARNVVTSSQRAFLVEEIARGSNILVSGATQAGKTTMLCALIAETPPDTRLVSVEETFEIRSAKHDWVALQTRQANLEGNGEVSLRRLVKESLRMRPGLLVVGEVREAESLDLLIAMNSGIPGMCTIHANSAAAAITKLCTLPLLAGANISADFVKQTVADCVDLVVHCEMLPSGERRVVEIAKVAITAGQISVEVLPC